MGGQCLRQRRSDGLEAREVVCKSLGVPPGALLADQFLDELSGGLGRGRRRRQCFCFVAEVVMRGVRLSWINPTRALLVTLGGKAAVRLVRGTQRTQKLSPRLHGNLRDSSGQCPDARA